MKIIYRNIVGWCINRLTELRVDKSNMPFYVENIKNTTETLSIVKNDERAPTLTIEYSIDNSTWNTLGVTSTTALTMTIASHQKVYLRCNATKWCEYHADGSISRPCHNTILGVSKVGGNIMSLLWGGNYTTESQAFPDNSHDVFNELFLDNITLEDASSLLLPIRNLSRNAECYGFMFRGCTSLTGAPVLPATTLGRECYKGMFKDCASLVIAPELPVLTLTDACYDFMFSGCTSLTKSPNLPAPTLVSNCYASMFEKCTSLREIKCNATDISATNCVSLWLYRVSGTGTFYKNANMNDWPSGDSGIPEGWTINNL